MLAGIVDCFLTKSTRVFLAMIIDVIILISRQSLQSSAASHNPYHNHGCESDLLSRCTFFKLDHMLSSARAQQMMAKSPMEHI